MHSNLKVSLESLRADAAHLRLRALKAGVSSIVTLMVQLDLLEDRAELLARRLLCSLLVLERSLDD